MSGFFCTFIENLRIMKNLFIIPLLFIFFLGNNTKVVKTDYYDLNKYTSKKDIIFISLRNINKRKSVVITLTRDLGCSVSFKGKRSSVKIKLENDVVVTFYHSGNTDCGDFTVIGSLTKNDIAKLKDSPIKVIRFTGTDYYHDSKDIVWKTFFQEKLDCIK